ncbi:MAG: LLM class flavin-dependent oxidoreductase [Proteobacteria bacterium]|nr:LLM class flavin-dependent oxidoreductase [Pseudomonadota bacterium]
MSVRIGLGLAGHPFEGASDLWEWVDLCEDSAVDSLWQSDRLISTDPLLEPMSLMAALAGRTRRLKFGMSVVSISFRDPLVLAKECATIDYLSDGRLLPAFGLGAPQLREWTATGIGSKGRGRRADEALGLLARLWEEDDVRFEGEFYRYDGVSISPKPVQRPLPLWIGGSSPAAIRRTARLGTGWLAGIQTAAQVAPVVEAIRRELESCGRSIDPDHYGAGFSYRFGSGDHPVVARTRRAFTAFQRDLDPEQYFAVGGADEILAQVERYKDAGISKFVLRPLAADMADLMDQTRRLIEEVLPEAHD